MVINVHIDVPKKLKNNILVKYSAFVSFPYNEPVITYIKGLSTRAYDPETTSWEIPINNLPGLCNKFTEHEINIDGIYHKMSDESDVNLPKAFKFKTKPYQHQIDGIKYGMSHAHFMLCDEQGLGKTKQIIDLAMALESEVNKVLIICGVNSLKYNWKEEVEKHSNEKAHILGSKVKANGTMIEGTAKDRLEDLNHLPDAKFIITNVETLRLLSEKAGRSYRYPIAEKIAELCHSGIFSMVAFDEAHKCKEPSAKQTQALLKISAKYMISMTGTPLMNKPLDLYVPLHWLGYEAHSYWAFKNHYAQFGGYGGHEIIGYQNLQELRDTLDAVMLRRLKSEVLDLPEKVHTDEYVEMLAKQAVIYKEVHAGIMASFNEIQFSDNPLSKLIRLRQATGCPSILTDKAVDSAKLDRMVELVEDLVDSGEKAIVFSNWSHVTDEAKKMLSKYNPAYITGDVGTIERQNEVNRFQTDDKCKVMIATIGAGGTGLTLTAAQTVIFLDEPWNRALKDQAEDRAHRIGTKGTVNIITLITKDTIDERIHELVYKKGLMSDALIDYETTKVSLNDIKYLLS